MFKLTFRNSFGKSFSTLKDKKLKKQIFKKIELLKQHAPLGKKLTGYPYWSLHIGAYRVIYELHRVEQEVEIVELLERKHNYRELKKI